MNALEIYARGLRKFGVPHRSPMLGAQR
uniref:Uncharacterized protein n=1 Tax=Streptomyces sp. FXJ1.235 TaxID=1454112 RepID=A0A2R3ZQ14_9ACTN|nr:hypothetical protein [Streptomyces sp. FXJ1.235]